MSKIKKETSAGGIIYKKADGKMYWLLIQHSSHKGWGFPKGHVGDKVRNETIEEAALREVEEEGGIKAKIVNLNPIDIHYMYRFQSYLMKKTVLYFLMGYISGEITDHDNEISDIKFVETNEVESVLTYKNDKDAFKKALTIIGAVDRI
jgi:8-oxo-dGTP pyrophosphatase MutT (NUDIX family)